MLGFGKKKETKLPADQGKKKDPGKSGTDGAQKKRTWIPKKLIRLILIILVVLSVVGISAYFVFTLYINPSKTDPKKIKYTQIKLTHVNLPEEILTFSFYHLPDLYIALVAYDNEMRLLDEEIARIETIGQAYPDQKKIADKEKKTWESTQITLRKAFLKIEKPVKETYVLFQVNKEQGRIIIETQHKELTDLALSALIPAQELTKKIRPGEQVPEGLIKETIYKLKKKFL